MLKNVISLLLTIINVLLKKNVQKILNNVLKIIFELIKYKIPIDISSILYKVIMFLLLFIEYTGQCNFYPNILNIWKYPILKY